MYAYNGIGRQIYIPERPLEPPDCWLEESAESCEPEYDKGEDELSGRTHCR